MSKKKEDAVAVSVKVIATSKGQNGGKIRVPGEKFTYVGILKDDKLPNWVEALEKLPAKKDPEKKPNLNDLVK